MNNSVEISRLKFSYGNTFELYLEEWFVRSGSKVALFGPSGCGKSTLLGLIAGILKPDLGLIKVLGLELNKLSESQIKAHRISNIGFIFQDFPLTEYLNTIENVLLPYRLNPALKLDNDAKVRATALLESLGLSSKLHRMPKALSQGERQRVAIARALITKPSLLLADEPTAGLDPQRAHSVMDLIEDISKKHNATLLMVTHDPSLLPRFDDTLDVASLTKGAL